MGTPDFAVGVLDAMIEAGHQVISVITAPDRPAGRGRRLTASAVKQYAASKQIPVLQPVNLKDPGFLKELENLKPDLQVVVAFRMLPKEVWEIPAYGTFNLHASLLPQYRGAAPINHAIINRESKTGVTTFFIDEQIDTGAIILKKEVAIAARETAGSLHDKLMHAGKALVLETIDLIGQGKATAVKQPEGLQLKPAPKLTAENTQIDWSREGEEIDAFIRGLSPYPAAWTILKEEKQEFKVKIYDAEFVEKDHDLVPGSLEVSKQELKIACPDGFLAVTEIQFPGKRKMGIRDFLNGHVFSEFAKFV